MTGPAGRAGDRGRLVAAIAAYGETDLVCHRAAAPQELAELQQEAWQPLLDWLAERHGARLEVTTDLGAAGQPAEALAALRVALEALPEEALAAVHAVAVITGSAVVALALAEGRIDAGTAWRASQIEEAFQTGRWGGDEEGEARRRALEQELTEAARILASLAT